ncbi:2,5-diamino-6-(ribosylamino)-4(3H)-pyrimidinone 5'-phosphate reductase [Coemansia biformis]|uniref:2,5-diamino-6-ribosylamino-4(3H)-pyrimidinone 5'-phosphate reductase n=1 Tax=Coemansia biformis TaxID=1286918 RepID=A0A9W7YBQ5_9FUNG|nr:2,5-diamino-6-(ribosylamino)-4(3H)-pyrimidinone 5'-phosphate reductase [Coemansia biformis]
MAAATDSVSDADARAFAHARDFLCRVPGLAAAIPPSVPSGRPMVTLTFAQSLDGKISRTDQRLLLSGSESAAMTHRLRTMHDAILVGVGTVAFDDPQLTARLLPPAEIAVAHHPQPVVLDPHLRTPLGARLLSGPRDSPRLRMPWLVAGPDHDRARRAELERCGATVVVVDDCDAAGRPRLDAVAAELHRRGIARLMVEGGARIIQAFLDSRLVDLLLVTVAPVLVGSAGVPAATDVDASSPTIVPVLYEQFGRDVVMAATLQHARNPSLCMGDARQQPCRRHVLDTP